MVSPVILASTSKNRRTILEKLGVPFRVVPSGFDEQSVSLADKISRVEAIARGKARAVASIHEGIIIAADTFTEVNGKLFEKPKTSDEAKSMLQLLSGQQGQSVTGVCVIDTDTQQETLTHRVVTIYCKPLTDAEIDQYVSQKPVVEWAAAYNPLDSVSASIFRCPEGYHYGLEYGLPMDVVAPELEKVGIRIDLSVLANPQPSL